MSCAQRKSPQTRGHAQAFAALCGRGGPTPKANEVTGQALPALPVPRGCGNMPLRTALPLRPRIIMFPGRKSSMSKPRISYVDPATVKDPAMIAEFERCAREGTPRPESQAQARDVRSNAVAPRGDAPRETDADERVARQMSTM